MWRVSLYSQLFLRETVLDPAPNPGPWNRPVGRVVDWPTGGSATPSLASSIVWPEDVHPYRSRPGIQPCDFPSGSVLVPWFQNSVLESPVITAIVPSGQGGTNGTAKQGKGGRRRWLRVHWLVPVWCHVGGDALAHLFAVVEPRRTGLPGLPGLPAR